MQSPKWHNMRAQEFVIESTEPGMYVYHAGYLPDQTAGLKSILTKGLQPSAEGYAGPGVYFAYDPDGGYYHVSKEEATMFRAKWTDLANMFGTYPANPNGIERDEDEIIVPAAVPASMLEVEYFPGEWWDLKSALAASRGPIDEADEPTRIKLGGGNSAAKAWIEKVYAKYPQTFQNNHVMPLGGSGDDQQFAMFELVPSFSKRGAVEVKWFQAYPLRAGVGSRAMKELQAMAREDGISLTLFPWDKGQVSQSKLTKFYRGQGFSPTAKGGKAMQWSPELAEGSTDLVQIAYWQQETMESGRWVKTKPIPRATAEKIVNSFERGEIVDVEQGLAEDLRVDVPNEEWLQDAIDYAKSHSPDRRGLPYMGKTTATVRKVELPVSLLKRIPGMRNEQQNVRQGDLAAIMKIMSDTGKLPIHAHSNEEYKPFINVAYDGSAWVNEGNHRIMAAYRLGWDSLPIEISYFDGGERVKSGPMYPGKIGL